MHQNMFQNLTLVSYDLYLLLISIYFKNPIINHKTHIGHQIIQTTILLGYINIKEHQKITKSQHQIHP